MAATDPERLPGDPDAVDANAVAAQLWEWAETHRQRELERGLRELENAGSVTDGQRAVVAALSQALTDELLAPPLAAIADEETAAAYVSALFDLDEVDASN